MNPLHSQLISTSLIYYCLSKTRRERDKKLFGGGDDERGTASLIRCLVGTSVSVVLI